MVGRKIWFLVFLPYLNGHFWKPGTTYSIPLLCELVKITDFVIFSVSSKIDMFHMKNMRFLCRTIKHSSKVIILSTHETSRVKTKKAKINWIMTDPILSRKSLCNAWALTNNPQDKSFFGAYQRRKMSFDHGHYITFGFSVFSTSFQQKLHYPWYFPQSQCTFKKIFSFQKYIRITSWGYTIVQLIILFSSSIQRTHLRDIKPKCRFGTTYFHHLTRVFISQHLFLFKKETFLLLGWSS